jgi:hypothetical protein
LVALKSAGELGRVLTWSNQKVFDFVIGKEGFDLVRPEGFVAWVETDVEIEKQTQSKIEMKGQVLRLGMTMLNTKHSLVHLRFNELCQGKRWAKCQ